MFLQLAHHQIKWRRHFGKGANTKKVGKRSAKREREREFERHREGRKEKIVVLR
jgi:hypothetical protein